MSSLWTPSGEHFPKKEADGAAVPPPTAPGAPGAPGQPSAAPPSEEAAQAEAQAAVDAMRDQLASTPAEVVVANHCYGLFELAAIYLSQSPPMLFQARLAIDGLGALLQGLVGRLGEAEPSLLESLSQLRLAYVRLEGAERTAAQQAAAEQTAAQQAAAEQTATERTAAQAQDGGKGTSDHDS